MEIIAPNYEHIHTESMKEQTKKKIETNKFNEIGREAQYSSRGSLDDRDDGGEQRNIIGSYVVSDNRSWK